MAAIIKIDQVGLPGGTNGESRKDGLATGALVTLTSVDPGLSNVFRLLAVAPGDTDAVSSLIQTGSPDVWTFTPTASVYGTYRIELNVDGEISIRTFAILTPNRGLRIPAFNERADPDANIHNAGAAQIEASEDNEGGKYTGWHDAEVDLHTKLDELDAADVPFDPTGLVTITGTNTQGALEELDAKTVIPTVTESTTSRLISNADNGKLIICTEIDTAIGVPDSLVAGFSCMFTYTAGSGDLTFSGVGATIHHPDSHNKIRAQRSVCAIIREDNTNYILIGDTKA